MMILRIQRFIHTSFILGWGVVALYWGIFADFEKLLHPMFQPWVICAGVALMVIAVLTANVSVTGRCSHDPTWMALLLGMGGLAAIGFYKPQALQMSTMKNRDASLTSSSTVIDTRDPESLKLIAEKPQDQVIPLTIIDILYAENYPDLRAALKERAVALEGQISLKNGLSLMRVMMSCCAADARPIFLKIHGNDSVNFKEGDWVEVQGTVDFEEKTGKRGMYDTAGIYYVAVFKGKELKPIREPEDIYLY